MIVLDLPAQPQNKSKTNVAGHAAEKQMAYYLKRAFDEYAYDYRVFNNLRLERRGMFAQIDHLVLHRYGFHLIESKSVAGTVTVNADGEFTRQYPRQSAKGIPSPIKQVQRQRELLQELLTDHKAKLRRTLLGPLVQGGFSHWYFHTLVAISDHGIIKTQGCKKPHELRKADQIVDTIRDFASFQKKGDGLTGFVRSLRDKKIADESLAPYSDNEIDNITDFLGKHHQPETTAASIQPLPESNSSAVRQPNPPATKPRLKPEVVATKKENIADSSTARPASSRPSNNMKRWSKAECEIVTQAFHAKTSAEAVAAQLGRTPKAVRMRAQILNLIQSPDNWP